MKFIIFQMMILTIMFSGCSTVSQYLPWGDETKVEVPVVPEESYGVVSYISSGDPSAAELRKKEAYEQMFMECNGKYEVIDVSTEESGSISISNGNGEHFNEAISRVIIRFVCSE